MNSGMWIRFASLELWRSSRAQQCQRATNTHKLDKQGYFHASRNHLIPPGQKGVCISEGNLQIIKKTSTAQRVCTLSQRRLCPDLYLEGKIGCSCFFFMVPSQLVAMRLPSRNLCSIPTGGHLFFITIWRSFPRHFSSSSTWLQYPTDLVLHSLLLNRISLWCPNTIKELIMHNELGHQ